jgi:hypothetical protein
MDEQQRLLLEDKFFREQSEKATAKLLEIGLSIDEISRIIKDYAKKYVAIKSTPEGRQLLHSSPFTFQMWLEVQPWYGSA